MPVFTGKTFFSCSGGGESEFSFVVIDFLLGRRVLALPPRVATGVGSPDTDDVARL